MNKLLTGILINPEDKSVQEVVTYGGLDAIKKSIGAEWIQGIRLSEDSTTLYVDEEFLLGDKSSRPLFWRLSDYETVIGGKGLILGVDRNTGESRSTKFKVPFIHSVVHFQPELQFVGLFGYEGYDNTLKMPIIGQRAKFKYPWVGICAPQYPLVSSVETYQFRGAAELTPDFVASVQRHCLSLRNDAGLSIKGEWLPMRDLDNGYKCTEFKVKDRTARNKTNGIVLFKADYEFFPRSTDMNQ